MYNILKSELATKCSVYKIAMELTVENFSRCSACALAQADGRLEFVR